MPPTINVSDCVCMCWVFSSRWLVDHLILIIQTERGAKPNSQLLISYILENFMFIFYVLVMRWKINTKCSCKNNELLCRPVSGCALWIFLMRNSKNIIRDTFHTQNAFYKMLMNVYLYIKECQMNDRDGASMVNVNFGWLKFLFFYLIESSIRIN